MVGREDEAVGIYVHVPFCARRCAYCDFSIVVGQERLAPDYFRALWAEIDAFARERGRRRADTVHFGGGTPSHVDPALLVGTLERLRAAFDVAADAEVALETNPEDVTAGRAAFWRGSGFDRITVGVQSLAPAGLAAVGRGGDAAVNRLAVELAAQSGFRSVGVDGIFGRPGQSVEEWRDELRAFLALPADHFSFYALETDARTPLVRMIERGTRPRPDDDAAAAMYEETVAALAAAGIARYEISNFARPGRESRHNVKYWTDQPYVGFGQSAASYVDGERWTNARRFAEYVAGAADGDWAREREPYDADRRMGEALVFGLRLAAGIDLDRLAARHGAPALGRRLPRLARAEAEGMIVADGPRRRLAERAFLIADELFVDLL